MSHIPTPADMGAIESALSPDVPVPQPPSAGIIMLHRGLEKDGTWHTHAKVRELRGVDEEALASFDITNHSDVDFLDEILQRGAVSVGDVDVAKHPQSLRYLIGGDRDKLLLGIAVATYGATKEFQARCTTCNEMNEVSVDLTKDIPMRELDDPFAATYKSTLRDDTEVTWVLPDGNIQAKMYEKRGLTMAARNTILLAGVVRTVNGEKVDNPMAWAKDLGMASRSKLISEIADRQPGPQLLEGVKESCAVCGATALVSLAWADLLPIFGR